MNWHLFAIILCGIGALHSAAFTLYHLNKVQDSLDRMRNYNG